MSGHAPSGALASAFAIPTIIHNWYQEQTFWLYYYGLSYSPKEALKALPLNLSPTFIDQVSGGLDAARMGLIDKTATRIASGEETKPSFGNALKGFLTYSQVNLRPVIDIAMRTGLSSPLRLAAVGMAILLVGDALSGGHIRDAIVQTIAGVNSESGRAANATTDKHQDIDKTFNRTRPLMPSAQPSFS